jgi:hypothetical protein
MPRGRPSNKLPCPVCDKLFSKQGLGSHKRTHAQALGLRLEQRGGTKDDYRTGYRDGWRDAHEGRS